MRTHVDLWSFCKGIRAMHWPHPHVNYAVGILRGPSRGFWLCLWTPVWHDGCGPYVMVGLGIVGFWRGY